jgi:DNA-directed RNA polymerase specialized sigma24 family protein
VRSPSGSLARSLPEDAELGDPGVRATLVSLVRRKVPEREVEDIVQDTIADALASSARPSEQRSLRNWLGGIARNKVVDFHRRASREDLGAVPEKVEPSPEPHESWDLKEWAEKRLPAGPNAEKALGWMLEEADGEKLERIAERENLPPEAVRQRVTRLRRHLRDTWAAEIAVLLAAGVLAFAFFLGWTAREKTIGASHDWTSRSVEDGGQKARAARERSVAFDRQAAGDTRGCLDALDRAAALDPDGDRTPDIQTLRTEAERKLAPSTPAPAPSAAPVPRRRPGYNRLPSDTAPEAPNPCVCPKGDPLCGCLTR